MKKKILELVQNRSISWKLYFLAGLMALLIALALGALYFAVNTLSAVRAFVGCESLWSKAQKDAIYSLRNYARTKDETYYHEYHHYLQVPLGGRKARIEMSKPNPNREVMYQGFIEGGNHPDDIEKMVKLFRRFHSVSYISKAIRVWTEGDSLIMELQSSAQSLHDTIKRTAATDEQKEAILIRINQLNKQLTIKEEEFSATLGEGSRWMEGIVLTLLFGIALTVEVSGLLLTISVVRGISKSIAETMRVVEKVTAGDFNTRVQVFSTDELGQLGGAVNTMTDSFEKTINARKLAEQKLIDTRINLEKNIADRTRELQSINAKLESKNKELESFAFITSHDLKAPLRAIGSLADWLLADYGDKLDQNGQDQLKMMKQRVVKMHELIEGILNYSRVGRADGEKQEVDLNLLIREITGMLHIPPHIKIITGNKLPVINYYKPLLTQVFENLITNAIKYNDKADGVIEITCEKLAEEWKFSISDNGIGIDKKYHEKIFEIFQRLKIAGDAEGTGIGLTIVKKIVENAGGQISLESTPGKGTRFQFTLPRS